MLYYRISFFEAESLTVSRLRSLFDYAQSREKRNQQTQNQNQVQQQPQTEEATKETLLAIMRQQQAEQQRTKHKSTRYIK